MRIASAISLALLLAGLGIDGRGEPLAVVATAARAIRTRPGVVGRSRKQDGVIDSEGRYC
jgi:hypothetical protein